MSEISNIQVFVRVVEDGSFSATARFLRITPSSVSRQISQLENELGARLFHRTTRKQSLTEAGEIYFQHSRRIVTDFDAARLAVNQLTNTPSGSLHITVEADFAQAFIAPVLSDFLDHYPDIQVRLSMSAGLLDLVDSGIDLAIRFGHLDDSSLIARKIAASHSRVCASPKYLELHGTPTHPGELATYSCLSFRTALGKNYWKFNTPEGELDVPISGRISANSVAFLRKAALGGLGIIMIPTWMIHDDLKHGHLIPLLEDFPLIPPSTPVNAVFAHNRHLAPKVRVFVDFLAEQMNKL